MPTRTGSPAKTCSQSGCGKALRARGLCSTHYNQQHQPGRHAGYMIVCVVCGADHRSARKEGRYCSDLCRAEDYRRRGIVPQRPPGTAPYVWTRRHRARVRARSAAKGVRGRRWVMGRCERCGTAFVAAALGDDAARYCSETCVKRSKSARRRARARSAEAERYSRHAIFERDGWRCHICRRAVRRSAPVPHPLAPTIDHLIPLAAGGGDTAANVATAHFLCNSIKSDRAGARGDQLALLG